MTYTVIITSNNTKARDSESRGSAAHGRTSLTVRAAVLAGSATVAVVAVGVASCAVVIRLRTVNSDKVRRAGADKPSSVLRRSLSVSTRRAKGCTTSVVVGSTGPSRHPASVAWADCTLSPVDDERVAHEDRDDRQPTTTVHQHEFRMRIFPAACCDYDYKQDAI